APSYKHMLWGLFLFNLVIKLVSVPLNLAEYTDGILQLTLFDNPNRLYPPLFTILSLALHRIIPGDLETAGRIVSALSSALIVFPLMSAARRIFGDRAALFAGILYSIAPVPMRWSVHAMTDALFAFLFFLSVSYILKAALEEEGRDINLAVATVIAVAAMMTRYQGMLLAAPMALVWLEGLKRRGRRSLIPVAAQFLWLIPLLWIIHSGFRHPEQFSERAGDNFFLTIVNIILLSESFLLYSPYFLTWPVCFAFLAGLFLQDWRRREQIRLFLLFGLLLVMTLILQAAFSSFQSRYLLPLVPFVCIFAGHGLKTLEERWRTRPAAFKMLLGITICWSLLFSFGTLFLQNQAWGDLKDAADFVRRLPPDTPVYSNEAYKDLGPVKMRYWSGREVLPFTGQPLPSGSVLCLHSAHGGAAAFARTSRWLQESQGAKSVLTFDSFLVPLLPDIMQEPMSHQNPLALTFRYTPQKFRTEIFRIP
ncbi:MAG TPA: glycosyltransferase family 39 protein, partial [Candidatus Sumerlaeota bacterium]|nr:glycosyltransferase family 39 protein [Candidatus Sumerlaeota bacterium]